MGANTLTTMSRGVCHIIGGSFCFRKVCQPKLIANLNCVHQFSSDLLLTLGGPGWCRSNYVRRRELYRLLRLPICYWPRFLFLNIRDYWETGGFLVLYAHNFLVHSVGLEPTSPLGTASLVLRVFQFRHKCICVRLYLRETVRWNLAANIYYD